MLIRTLRFGIPPSSSAQSTRVHKHTRVDMSFDLSYCTHVYENAYKCVHLSLSLSVLALVLVCVVLRALYTRCTGLPDSASCIVRSADSCTLRTQRSRASVSAKNRHFENIECVCVCKCVDARHMHRKLQKVTCTHTYMHALSVSVYACVRAVLACMHMYTAKYMTRVYTHTHAREHTPTYPHAQNCKHCFIPSDCS